MQITEDNLQYIIVFSFLDQLNRSPWKIFNDATDIFHH